MGQSEQDSSVAGDEGIEGDDMLLATRVYSRRNGTGEVSWLYRGDPENALLPQGRIKHCQPSVALQLQAARDQQPQS